MESREVNGFTVTVDYDRDPPNPREDFTHGCELALSHKRYDVVNESGLDLDDFGKWEQVRGRLMHDGALAAMYVHAIDHSGLFLSVQHHTDLLDPWDAGILGVAYVTRKNWEDTQGTPWTGDAAQLQRCYELISSDVEDYGSYLNGSVYSFTVTDTDGEVMDEGNGIFGYDGAWEEAEMTANALVHDAKCNGTLNRRTGSVEHDGECPVHPKLTKDMLTKLSLRRIALRGLELVELFTPGNENAAEQVRQLRSMIPDVEKL